MIRRHIGTEYSAVWWCSRHKSTFYPIVLFPLKSMLRCHRCKSTVRHRRYMGSGPSLNVNVLKQWFRIFYRLFLWKYRAHLSLANGLFNHITIFRVLPPRKMLENLPLLFSNCESSNKADDIINVYASKGIASITSCWILGYFIYSVGSAFSRLIKNWNYALAVRAIRKITFSRYSCRLYNIVR